LPLPATTLHDIVQAGLLGALFELGRVKAEAERNGDSRLAEKTTLVAEQVRDLAAGLREFAREIYPAVLDASGLPAAIEAHPDLGVLVLSQHVEPGYALELVEDFPRGSGSAEAGHRGRHRRSSPGAGGAGLPPADDVAT
jgi:hypothetical protein